MKIVLPPSFQSCEIHTDQHTIHLPKTSRTDDVVRKFCQVPPPSILSAAIGSMQRQLFTLSWPIESCRSSHYDHRRLLEMVKETGCGFSLRSLLTGTSSVHAQIWTSVAAGDSKLRHQPSIRSVTRLPTSQAPQVPPFQAMAARSMFSPRRS